MQQPDQGPRDAALKALLTQLLTFEDFMLFQKMMHEKNLEAESMEYQAMSSSSDHRNVSPTANWACPSCTYMNAPSCQICEYCHAARYGSPPQKMQDTNETEDSNFKAALEESFKEEKLRQRQAQREAQQLAMVKEESLRESSSRFGQSNSSRAALKEARDLELAKIESLRMSNTASRGFVRKKSLRRLSSEEQMQSFKKESKHMAPQMLRQLVPVTADRGIRNA